MTWVDSVLETNIEASRLPIARKHRHGLHFKQDGRQRLAIIGGAPMHYFEPARREWLPIDTDLQRQPDGAYGGLGVPFRVSRDGEVKMPSAGYRHRTWRVGVFRNGRIAELARLPDGLSDGENIVREVGDFRHQIRLLPAGLREELILHEAPELEPGALFVVETLLPEGGVASGLLREHRHGELWFRDGSAIDAAGSKLPLMRWVEGSGATQRLYSAVPAEWLAQASYPVVIDPDLNVNPASDATIEGTTAATSSVLDVGSGTLSAGAMTFGGAPHLWRSYLKFDTSDLGVAAEVDQVNLRVIPTNLLATYGWTVYVRSYNWSAHDPLTNGNREAAWDGLLAASNSAVLATNANPIGTFVTSANIPVGSVSIIGNTYYGLWCNQEATTFSNNQGAFHQYPSTDNATAGNRPLLLIQYRAGYPRTGPIPGRIIIPVPRARLVDTRTKLRARARRTALQTSYDQE